MQRIISVGGQTYGADRAEQFKAEYQKDLAGMLSAIQDLPHAPRTIDDALRQDRTFFLRAEEIDGETWYSADATPFVKDVNGGRTREVGARPELVRRPAQGFEELELRGLLMCVGIVLIARGSRVEAVSGAHFVTPRCVQDHALSAQGARLVEEQVAMTRPHGHLSAVLMYAAEERSRFEDDAREAVKLVAERLAALGVADVKVSPGAADRSYRLDAKD